MQRLHDAVRTAPGRFSKAMTQSLSGRASRKSRVLGESPGIWASSSQDFALLAGTLYIHSAKYAKHYDGNYSIYTLAGIPMLLSALRCLLIELNAGMHSAHWPKQDVLAKLAGDVRDINIIVTHYPIPDYLKSDLLLLWEVRNEIVHPAHGPGTDQGMTPGYLMGLRDRSLLNSTGKEPDYTWIEQLKSHRLFRWTFSTVQQTVAVLLTQHDVQLTDPMGPTLYATYSRHEEIDQDS